MTQLLPQGTVTVLFTDIEGSTALRVRLGDAAGDDVFRAHDDLLRSEVARHDGVEVKSLGDGFMFAFESARKAVQCALAVQRALRTRVLLDSGQPLGVRMGLHTGEVVEQGGDLFGSAVHAAARIADAAVGGQVLASEVVRLIAGDVPGVAFDDAGTHILKGFDEPWRLVEPRQVVVAEVARAPRRAVLVGREDERTVLRRMVDSCASGRGGVVLLGGEPGVGKSRLAEAVLEEAQRRDLRALRSKCLERDVPPPYGPVIGLFEMALRTVDRDTIRAALGDTASEIARILPELPRIFLDVSEPAALPPDQEERFLFNSVAEFVSRAGEERPLVLLVDDLHWADAPSLRLIEDLAPRLADQAVLLLGTYRTKAIPPESPLRTMLGRLTKEGLVVTLDLDPLPKDGVEALLHALAGSPPPPQVVDLIYERTDGNPFFVTELYRHLADSGALFGDAQRWVDDVAEEAVGVPASVHAVLDARLGQLGGTARKVLTVAAVAGRTVDLDLLRELVDSGLEDIIQALEEIEEAGLGVVETEERSTRIAFAHDLVRDAFRAGLSELRRRHLHLQMAEAMQRRATEASAMPDEIAHHLLGAGDLADPRRTAGFLRLAGDRAREAAALDEAHELYRRALDLLSHDGDRDLRADLLAGLGHAVRGTSGWEAAVGYWREAVALYEQLDRLEDCGRLIHVAAWELIWAGQAEDGFALIDHGLEILSGQDSPTRARLLAARAQVLAVVGAPDQAEESLTESQRVVSDRADGRLRLDLDSARCSVDICYCRWTSVEMRGHRLATGYGELGASWEQAEWEAWTLLAYVATGRFNTELDALQAAKVLAERLDSTPARLILGRLDLYLGYREGDFAEVERCALRDLDMCREATLPWGAAAHMWRGLVALHGGRWAEASAAAAAGREADVVPGAWFGVPQIVDVLAAGLRQDRAGIDAALEIVPPLPEKPLHAGIGPVGTQLAAIEAYAEVGAHREVAARGPLLAAALDQGCVVTAWNFRTVEALEGLVAAAERRWEDAEQHFESASRRAERLGHTLDLAEIPRWHARMLLERDAAGDRAEADRLLSDSAAAYDELGVPVLRDAASRLLANV